MSDLYQYKPLLHDRSLRILVLHPARITDAPLMIDLQETPLDKAHHKFDALSYVWGLRSNDIDSAAFCCGKTIPIGPNCDAALRRLRSTRRIRRLFVDAICMDQSNDEEKEGQIKLMGEFYISARRVLIWLGKGSEQTDRAFKHFRRLYRFRHLVNDKKISETLRKRVWDVIGSGYVDQEEGKTSGDRDLHFWLDFIDRPYFERVWPLQETAVASRPILVCGSSTAPLRAANFATFFITPRLHAMVAGLDQDRFWGRWSGFETHQYLATLFAHEDHSHLWKRPSDMQELRRVLFLVRKLQSKEPLDKLYSLYTIMKGFCPNFPEPHYAISPTALWVSATLSIVKSMRCLDLIMDIHHEGREDGLPSWSFDWGLKKNDLHQPQWDAPGGILLRNPPSGTAWDKSPTLALNSGLLSPHKLRIRGKIHSKVLSRSLDLKVARDWYCDNFLASSDPNKDASPELHAVLTSVTKLFFEWAIPKAGSQYSRHGEDQEVCRHLLIWAEIPEEDASKAFEEWYPKMKHLQWLQADESLNDPDDKAHEMLAGMCQSMMRSYGKGLAENFHNQLCVRRLYRSFFRTEDGRAGDAFHTVREGDLIVLLCWAKVPAIIRPLAEDSSLYTLVGFAYVQGLVDCHAWDLKEEELQEFALV